MLDSTAKVSDIVTALKNMQGINQKADLKSALVAKGIVVSEKDNMADLISKITNITTGIRYATGVRTILDNSFTISDLAFNPRIVVFFNPESSKGGTLAGFVQKLNYIKFTNGSARGVAADFNTNELNIFAPIGADFINNSVTIYRINGATQIRENVKWFVFE